MASMRTYVLYSLPGAFVPEQKVEMVYHRDPQLQANEAPPGAYAFYYFDVITAAVEVAGRVVDARSDKLNISPTHYINGQLFDRHQVEKLAGNRSILLDNMRANGWDNMVRCRSGNFQPFKSGHDQLVSTS